MAIFAQNDKCPLHFHIHSFIKKMLLLAKLIMSVFNGTFSFKESVNNYSFAINNWLKRAICSWSGWTAPFMLYDFDSIKNELAHKSHFLHNMHVSVWKNAIECMHVCVWLSVCVPLWPREVYCHPIDSTRTLSTCNNLPEYPTPVSSGWILTLWILHTHPSYIQECMHKHEKVHLHSN